MPSRLAATVLTVDAGKMHQVDTRNAENLFGMWSVFSKCAESMEEGRRLENLSWRLWNRETFCCSPSQQACATTPAIVVNKKSPAGRVSEDIPELSASVDSAVSEESEIESFGEARSQAVDIKQPSSWKYDPIESRSRGKEKHVTSLVLEKMVITIKEKKELEPLSPIPTATVHLEKQTVDTTPRALSPSPGVTDTLANAPHESSESASSTSQIASSESSNTSELSSHSVVRGFSSEKPSSYRSQSRLAPTPIPPSANPTKDDQQKKKGAMFMLGGSSGEDESSLEEHMSYHPHRSSLSDGLKQPLPKRKQTSFKEEVVTRTIDEGAHEDEEVFESDEEDEDVSESAIEDDDDSSDWEDSVTESGRSSVEQKPIFQRVDSKPNLTSRRSLLTNLLHQSQRGAALTNAASKSTPVMQRSRTSSPIGPSIAASPDDEPTLTMRGPEIPRSKPIIMTTSNIHPPALSPRTTRRNMLATELTESLRRHLLHERQQKSTTANAILKRRHTAHDMANLQDYPVNHPSQSSKNTSKNNSWNHYFDHGLGEYHQKGW